MLNYKSSHKRLEFALGWEGSFCSESAVECPRAVAKQIANLLWDDSEQFRVIVQ